VALLFAPLGRLPYGDAILLWWLLQAACFGCAGFMLLGELKPPPDWRSTAWLGLAAFYPVVNTFWNGQLAAMLLLVLLIGLKLLRSNRPVFAGSVLSLMALKPQFAVGVAVWLLLRRDWRAVAGFGVGLILQPGAVAAALGPEVVLAYVRSARFFSQFYRVNQMTPDHQHALAGILVDLFGDEYGGWAMSAHLFLVTIAGVLLWRVVRMPLADRGRLEASAAVIFTLLATPHLLTYDLSYLLIPIAYFLSMHHAGKEDASRPEILLYLCATLAPLYVFLGFSIVPGVLIWVLYSLSARAAARPVQGLQELPPVLR
jgi:hypothetical protein